MLSVCSSVSTAYKIVVGFFSAALLVTVFLLGASVNKPGDRSCTSTYEERLACNESIRLSCESCNPSSSRCDYPDHEARMNNSLSHSNRRNRVEPFVDDFWVETVEGDVTHVLRRPEKRDVVYTLDAAWEDAQAGYFVALEDEEGKIRMYYRAQTSACRTNELNQKNDARTAVIFSDDGGLTFYRPDLGLFEVDGISDTNVVFTGGHKSLNFHPFIDTLRNPDDEYVYKAITGVDGNQSGDDGIFLYGSVDGIHDWKLLQNKAILNKDKIFYHSYHSYYDSLNTIFVDSNAGTYRLFSRANVGQNMRSIQSSTSQDCRRFSTPIPVLLKWKGGVIAKEEQFYLVCVYPLKHAEHILMGHGMRVYPDFRCDSVLLTSRDDGRSWFRLGGFDNWIDERGVGNSPGTHHSTYDTYPVCGFINSADEKELYAYTIANMQNRFKEDVFLNRYTLPFMRFASYSASKDGGSLVTYPMPVDGDNLLLNYESKDGHVIVEILDGWADTAPYSVMEGFSSKTCKPLTGNALDSAVLWNGVGISPLRGKSVRLRFTLKNSSLFAFQIS